MSNKQLITEIEIPEYITKVQTSESQRRKYYRKRKAKAGPRKGQLIWKPRDLTDNRKEKVESGEWTVDSDNYLRDENGDRVVANPRSAGEPNYEYLSGNRFSSGMHHRVRITLVNGLKDFFRKHIREKLEPFEKFPIRQEWDMYTTIDPANFDMINFWFYVKYFEDALMDEDIIPEDNIKYITQSGAPFLYPVDNWDDRKFVIRFYHDQREILKQYEVWNQ